MRSWPRAAVWPRLQLGHRERKFADQGRNQHHLHRNKYLAALSGKVPIKALIKKDPSLKATQEVEGWVIMVNSKKKKAAMEFANFTVSMENSDSFNKAITKTSEKPADLQFTAEKFDKFGYLPNWSYMSANRRLGEEVRGRHRIETLGWRDPFPTPAPSAAPRLGSIVPSPSATRRGKANRSTCARRPQLHRHEAAVGLCWR